MSERDAGVFVRDLKQNTFFDLRKYLDPKRIVKMSQSQLKQIMNPAPILLEQNVLARYRFVLFFV